MIRPLISHEGISGSAYDYLLDSHASFKGGIKKDDKTIEVQTKQPI